eukprot:Plantae.Rhodophyta-Purpureofilum_apyrenoidigerum.ctg24988.p1 GENE.Plantae.Rhodophyta-Purpureofilum_apyrenoidigerum.ctg24988~~Plantae.Rhodophyta-Purpureofilum_apyrenoidigerum.ctg24988.p1  ORF type:complete len:230 (-),score=29.10 Plantae.Rhodophyta-Purpureofilum_apyrenoidigerum.ctg24988:160-849(-)
MGVETVFRCESMGDLNRESLPKGKKIVHLIRHGQGFHNEAAEREFGGCQCGTDARKCVYNRPDLKDARLTKKGESQATALSKLDMRPQLVLVSPLTRTLQTASLAFPEEKSPMRAVEEIREVLHHECDRRGTIEEVRVKFPHVEFGSNLDNEDKLFPIYNGYEPEDIVWQRGKRALSWLMERPESELAIVSHSGFLRRFMAGSVNCSNAELRKPWVTGECRSVIFSYPN